MSSSSFQIKEHVIPAQHIREYPDALRSNQHDVLKIAVKEYIPLDNLDPAPGSVTVIAFHANGLPKETYEPLWEDLHRTLKVKIKAIWIADSSHQGASGVLNEEIQGDDPSYFDHSRDVLGMVNHFRDRITRPLVGIAHSMGTIQLIQLSLMHPRLFHSIALIEPIIQDEAPAGPNAAFSSSHRPDLWPSRSKAESAFKRNPFFKTWDQRVLGRYVQFGLRDLPTAIHPNTKPGQIAAEDGPPVTLTTTKHQEAWSFVRSNFTPQSARPKLSPNDRLLSPDMDPKKEGSYLFHRAECVIAMKSLPHLRPSVLWLFGTKSPLNRPAAQKLKVSTTGTAVGGNGGVEGGRVETATVEGAGHMVPLEKVGECAGVLAGWLEKQMDDFNAQEKFFEGYDSNKSEKGMLVVSKEWLKGVAQKATTKRPLEASGKQVTAKL